MIGFLRGKLVSKQPPTLLMDVNGVGYEVDAPMSTFFNLPELGAEASLFTHLSVREDAHVLFGFATEAERRMFRTLIKVSGVGPKSALGILSGISAEEFAQAVQSNDTAALVRLPGIGKKTAERLIVEMRDRVDDWGGDLVKVSATGSAGGVPRANDPVHDAVSALQALGYKPNDAARMVKAVDSEGLSSDEIIRLALKGTVQ